MDGNWLMLEPEAVRVLSKVYASTEDHLLVTGKVDVSAGNFQFWKTYTKPHLQIFETLFRCLILKLTLFITLCFTQTFS